MDADEGFAVTNETGKPLFLLRKRKEESTGFVFSVELTTGTSLYMSKRKADVPRNAIKSGLSPCGNVYVGIVCHEDEIMPAKIIPAYNLTYYAYKGKEYSTSEKTVSVSEFFRKRGENLIFFFFIVLGGGTRIQIRLGACEPRRNSGQLRGGGNGQRSGTVLHRKSADRQ